MKKEDSALLASGIVTLAYFVYGLRSQRGWKYWVFCLIFISSAGYGIGYALGEEKPKDQSNGMQI